MVDFEMPLKYGGNITYNEEFNTIIIEDDDCGRASINVNELIRFTETNFWKYLSKQENK